jgi:hypothetical protein
LKKASTKHSRLSGISPGERRTRSVVDAAIHQFQIDLERAMAPMPDTVKPKRVILVWIDKEGRGTNVADTIPHLPVDNQYDSYMPGRGGTT